MESATIFTTTKEAEYLVRQAQELALSGDHARAMATLEKTIAAYPKYSEAYALLGNCQECLDRNTDAVASYEKALQLDPGHADVWFYKGVVLKKIGMTREAMQCIEKSMELYCGR